MVQKREPGESSVRKMCAVSIASSQGGMMKAGPKFAVQGESMHAPEEHENSPVGEVTRLLRRWTEGDAQARDALAAELYGELRRIAGHRMRGERADHTLQPTALVNEAWLKLARGEPVDWRNRTHFIAVAARAMRQILVDSGRRKRAGKRTDDLAPATLWVETGAGAAGRVDLIDLDRALSRLETLAPEQARLVELRYFGGLTIDEAAEVMETSPATANRAWRAARAWLYTRLEPLEG